MHQTLLDYECKELIMTQKLYSIIGFIAVALVVAGMVFQEKIDFVEIDINTYHIADKIELLFSLFIWGYMAPPIIPFFSGLIAIFICPNNMHHIGGAIINLIPSTLMLILAFIFNYCVITCICFEVANLIFLITYIHDYIHSKQNSH